MACVFGHETVVKFLLDGGSDVDKVTQVSKISWELVNNPFVQYQIKVG